MSLYSGGLVQECFREPEHVHLDCVAKHQHGTNINSYSLQMAYVPFHFHIGHMSTNQIIEFLTVS